MVTMGEAYQSGADFREAWGQSLFEKARDKALGERESDRIASSASGEDHSHNNVKGKDKERGRSGEEDA